MEIRTDLNNLMDRDEFDSQEEYDLYLIFCLGG